MPQTRFRARAGASFARRLRFALLAAALGALGGCVTMETTYQPQALTGGYAEQRLGPDTYRVQSAGNAYASLGFVEGMAMLRAAELTRAAGYDRFIVTDNQIGVGYFNVLKAAAGGSDMSFATGGEPDMSRLYLSAGLTPKTPYVGPSSIRVPREIKPMGHIVIRMVKADDPAAADAIDAAGVIERLRPRFTAGR
ncbi:hypothetical protein GCM10008171_33370 [Methylopila jiangsuensis]|uniref:DUF4136 domain-containing protein n=1 Tax=Methylopila jiangsuensis TaxID=586230 RepID=A0A9W6JM88_9HYPH|nr:hypothetical protein [Methylopila jiangsuensis]MDR6284529.1 hypothetical protein [Methylopila jiangsuensis]GLK78083.1 hypothetical protein GCM10008171_33370 [Methylopila jiangsuensis]